MDKTWINCQVAQSGGNGDRIDGISKFLGVGDEGGKLLGVGHAV